VWRWQRRFADAGIDSLLRNATRQDTPGGGRGDADLRRAGRVRGPSVKGTTFLSGAAYFTGSAVLDS
jgi:hypothetical protein